MISLIIKMKKIAIQGVKHLLVGGFATIVDLKVFEILLAATFFSTIWAKAISFLVSALIKYAGNKYWAFESGASQAPAKEALVFFIITIVGLAIDLGAFYCAVNIFGPQFGLSASLWTKLSVIIAAATAATWNFLGYKFLVFKK